jgi:hypothetical protein
VFSSDRLEIREEEDGGTVIVKVAYFIDRFAILFINTVFKLCNAVCQACGEPSLFKICSKRR